MCGYISKRVGPTPLERGRLARNGSGTAIGAAVQTTIAAGLSGSTAGEPPALHPLPYL
jgi:hypothetical protein